MPTYSYKCSPCGTQVDRIATISARNEQDCDTCKARLERVYTSGANSVIGDDIPGGLEIRHGLVHADGSPMKFYTKSAIFAEAKRRGLTLVDRYVPIPKSGSDKVPKGANSRWI